MIRVPGGGGMQKVPKNNERLRLIFGNSDRVETTKQIRIHPFFFTAMPSLVSFARHLYLIIQRGCSSKEGYQANLLLNLGLLLPSYVIN